MADPSREIPGDEDFGKRVAAARDARGMTQRELAARLGITQPAISDIESGGSSKYIPDVCRVLNIPGPMFGWSTQQQQWAITGFELEARSPATFRLAMTMIKQMLDELKPDEPPPKPPEPPPKKKAKAIGSANVGGFERPSSRRLRAGDELPHEKKKH